MLEGFDGSISIANPKHDFIEAFATQEKGEAKEQLNGIEDGCEMPLWGNYVSIGEHACANEIGDEVVEQCRDCFCQNPQANKGGANRKPTIKGGRLVCRLARVRD